MKLSIKRQVGDNMSEVEDFKKFLIEKSHDPLYPMTTTERALYALLTLPHAAQEICTEAERETVIQAVRAAIDAAIEASVERLIEKPAVTS
jgi:hypothetical protein